MSINNKYKSKRKRLTVYHAQISFTIEEDFILPHAPQLGHVLWEQQGLLHDRGNVAPNASVEVPE